MNITEWFKKQEPEAPTTDYEKEKLSYTVMGVDKHRRPAFVWQSPKYESGKTIVDKKSVIFKITFFIIAPTMVVLWLLLTLGYPQYMGIKVDPSFSAALSMMVVSMISAFTGASYGNVKHTKEEEYIQYHFVDFGKDIPEIRFTTEKFTISPNAHEKSTTTQFVVSVLALALTFVWILGGSDIISVMFKIPLITDKAEFTTLTNLVLIIISLISGVAGFNATKK